MASTVAAGGLAAVGGPAGFSAAQAQTPPAPPLSPPATPDEALERLAAGNARYVANEPLNADHSVERAQRAAGQQPFAAIVACSDSRVAPEIIFDQGLGDLFVVRVAGNFINEDGLASLEFAAAVLGVQAIVVLGHTGCGAVNATIQSIEDRDLPPGHLPSLVNAIRPAVYDVLPDNPPDLLEAAIARNARLNAEAASTSHPILSELHGSGALVSRAGVYDIATGKVAFL
ncbi:carbonic anhydrase [Roseibium sp. RKSG952]|uniref:carbonic anhydrase n=1 Tax=Roseibium sp. RKSG952 TaxID=2529384 RepID=UPI0012BD3A03|nr:carbonic anhydrase [Roseibium sp. RKSG952]MTH98114.1 carbonic anhydrase [Roseibium sp. RKSG952]